MNTDLALAIQVTAIVLCVLGILLILSWFLTGRARGYLLYLGLAFLSGAVSPIASSGGAIIALLLSLFAVIMAFIEAVQYMRARAVKLRAEVQERESAFAEMMKMTEKKRLLAEQVKPPAADDEVESPRS